MSISDTTTIRSERRTYVSKWSLDSFIVRFVGRRSCLCAKSPRDTRAPCGRRTLRDDPRSFDEGGRVRHCLIYWSTATIVMACASANRNLPPQPRETVPPMAIAALIRASFPEAPWLTQAQALCVARVRPGPPPSIMDRFLPPFDSLVDLPIEAQSELAIHTRNIHRWSSCQVDIVTRSDVRVPGGVSVRATRARALFVWIRDVVPKNDSTAIGEVGYWVGSDSGFFACEAVRRKAAWIPGRCTLKGQS